MLYIYIYAYRFYCKLTLLRRILPVSTAHPEWKSVETQLTVLLVRSQLSTA